MQTRLRQKANRGDAMDIQDNVEAKKKRSSKTRRKLVAILRRLKKDCEKIKTLNDRTDYYEKHFLPVFLQYAQEAGLSPGGVQSIRNDIDHIDALRGDLESSCDTLKKVTNLDPSLIKELNLPFLPRLGDFILSHVFISILAIVLVTAAGFGLSFISSTATVEIRNLGCTPFATPPNLAGLPLVKVWNQPIQDGSSDFATLPPISMRVNAKDPNHITAYILGIIPIDFGPAGSAHSVMVNGSEVLNQDSTLSLNAQGTNTVVISCQ